MSDKLREQIAREIKTWCDADFRYQGYHVGIAKPIEPLADQIIPLVRAECLMEIADYIEINYGIVPVATMLEKIRCGTFKRGNR